MKSPILMLAFLSGSAMAAGATNPVDQDTWLIAGGGGKPERFVVLANDDSTRKNGSSASVDVRMLFESQNRPEMVSGTYSVDCKRNRLSASDIQIYRSGQVIGQMPDVASQAPSDFGEEQIARFVCNRSEDGSHPEATAANDNGKFLFIGSGKTELSANEFVRGVLWSNRVLEELQPDQESTKALSERLTVLGDHFNKVAKGAKKQQDEMLRLENRQGSSPAMEALIGKPEHMLIASFGTPDSFRDGSNGERWLFWHRGWANDSIVLAGTNTVVGGGYSQQCTLTVLVVDGLVYDYSRDNSGSSEDNGCRAMFGQ